MRVAPPALLALAMLWPALAAGQTVATKPTPAPAIGCPSLANLRMLLRRAGDDSAAAAAVLADDKADHLGCVVLTRGTVIGIADRAAFDGRAYECAGLQGTGICHWTLAGAVVPATPPPAGKAPAGTDKPPAERGRR